jgi:serine/threonine-protein kinase RsbW
MVSETPGSSSMVIESKPTAIGSVRGQILSKLEANNFGGEDIFAVHLALEEAFINAVRHGNKMDSAKEIKIDYSVGPDKIEVSVTDEGEGFDPESVPDPRYGENLYKPEGRGLFLMRSYMDTVKFNERGNSVCMVKYKEKSSPPKGVPNGTTKSENETQA